MIKLAAVTAANFAAQFLVVSALGADAGSRFYYNQVKGEMEAAVRQTLFRAIHIFRPSVLLGQRATPRLGEQVGGWFLTRMQPLLRGRWHKYRPVAAAAVARAMLRAAAEDSGGIHIHELSTAWTKA